MYDRVDWWFGVWEPPKQQFIQKAEIQNPNPVETTQIETAYSRVFFDLFWGRWKTSLKFNIDTIQQPTFNRRYLFQSSMFGTQVEFPD